MAPFPLTGATSLISKNDNNRNKMIFQHILEDVFQQQSTVSRLHASTSPLFEIKRRFELSLIAQQNNLPRKTLDTPTSPITNDIPSVSALVKLSLSSSSPSSSSVASSHDHRPYLKSPSTSSDSLTMIPLPTTHVHNDFYCLNDGFFLLDDIEKHFFGVDILCLKFCAGRLSLNLSRKCWMGLKSCVLLTITIGSMCSNEDNAFMMKCIKVNADWIGIHNQKNYHRLLLQPTSIMLTPDIKRNLDTVSDLVSGQKTNNDDVDIYFIDQVNPFPPDQYPIVDFITPYCHVEPDSFLLSPSISSTSTTSTSSCAFLSPPGSPLFDATTTFPLYNHDDQLVDESEDQYETSSANASLVALIQETLQYIHSSPSHHSYSTELESLVPKMGNFLSHSM